MISDQEKKEILITQSILSKITPEYHIKNNRSQIFQNIVKQLFKKFQRINNLQYLCSNEDYIGLKFEKIDLKGQSEYEVLIVQQLKQNKSIIQKGFELFGIYNKEISDILNDNRFPQHQSYYFLDNFLIRSYKYNEDIQNDGEFIFNSSLIKSENIPFIKKYRINVYREFNRNEARQQLDIISRCPNLNEIMLYLVFNQYTKEGIQELINQILNTLKQIKLQIRISNSSFHKYNNYNTINPFYKFNCDSDFFYVKSLEAQHHNNSINIKDFQIIQNQIFQFSNLGKLFLTLKSIDFGTQGIADLGNCIGQSQQLKQLFLNLNGYEFKPKELCILSQEIGKLKHLAQLVLIFQSSNIIIQDILIMFFGLSKCTQLNFLYMDFGTNQKYAEDMTNFPKMIKKLKNLQTLQLIWNSRDIIQNRQQYDYMRLSNRLVNILSLKQTFKYYMDYNIYL